MRLEGKVALVTGAGSGIGRAIAVKFATEGAAVAVGDINEETAAATAEKVRSAGVAGLSVKADVSSSKETQNMVARAVAELGRIDILVNNAGVGDYKPFLEITEEAWDRLLSIHLKGAFNCTKAVLGDMLARRSGCIVNISSLAGTTGTPFHVHYSAAKAGIIGLTKALAKEIARHGIRVNAVAPGWIDTPLGHQAEDFFARLTSRNRIVNPPLGVSGTPEDIAAACTYLASDEAGYVTGPVLSPNGGAWI
jgi:NAD(P)-dependent dehydrogenase (short-subunit alcohol dehydrogenase family)